MTVDATNVRIGTPDQKTTGAIMDAVIGSTLPTDAISTPDKAFTPSGYCSEDGLTLTKDVSTNDIKDWSGSIVRKVLESFDGTITWTEIEMTYESMCHAFGTDNVTKTAATAEHGEQLTLKIGANLPAARSWVFNMKDGDSRIRIVVPNGQVTSVDEITFNSTDAVSLPITLSCYPDANGDSIIIYTDDGKVGV